MTFTKILIANRGEIAVRVNRTAQALGYRTVAVFSDADTDALHVGVADEAIQIGPAPVKQSYLNIEKIIEACWMTGADAVHPGYGLLAENADFAEALANADIAFIGPSAKVIRAMGDKAAAKKLMLAAGVPCIQGYYDVEQSDQCLIREAERIGFPIMVKAVAGGGGRGMRLVKDRSGLEDALALARAEAESAFGSGALMLERAIVAPRHVEIQVFADQAGNVIHLGERDCSIQRHHQKVLEESPSPAVTTALRLAMVGAAVAAARAIDYQGAGTVEFLLEASGEFYFLEMNTRLQVEHPVTEMITGVDLVAWQIAVAEGEPLPLAQREVKFRGHAIEARLCAEAPTLGFEPQTGVITTWLPACGAGIRIDSGVASGSVIGPYYDSLMAKVIGYGDTRVEARRNLSMALEDTLIFGVQTNRRFLLDCLAADDFLDGAATTAFVAETFGEGGYSEPEINDVLLSLAAVELLRTTERAWPESLTGYSSSFPVATPMVLMLNDDQSISVHVVQASEGEFRVDFNEVTKVLHVQESVDGQIHFECDGVRRQGMCFRRGDNVDVSVGGVSVSARDTLMDPPVDVDEGGTGKILAPMDGVIVQVEVESKVQVEKGDLLLVLEAMKMQHRVIADISGKVAEVIVKEGEQVGTRTLLVEIEADSS